MTIVEARVIPYTLPLSAPWRTASGDRRVREGALIHVADAAGFEGVGEAAPLPGRTEPLDACLAALRRAAEVLRAERPPPEAALEAVRARVPELAGADPSPPRGGTPVGGARAARAALVTALFDLQARREGLPLAAWLAASSGRQGEAASRVPVNASIPSGSTRRTVASARRAVERGFRCLKLKVGRDPDDLGRVGAVREGVGSGVALRLDANGAWGPEEALRKLEALAPLEIEYVEQPLAPGGTSDERSAAVARLAELRRAAPVPIAADESASDPAGAEAILRAGAADVLVLKPAVLGGPDVALRLALRARKAGVGVVVTSALDGVVGRLAALHTAAALGPGLRPCGLATGGHLADEMAEGLETIVDGWLRVPDAAGLGARLRRT